MITYLQAIIIGLLQGVSELFPVSSLGHSVILPQLVGWNIHQQDPFFLTFLVATHLATAIVLVGFFWEDWKRIVKGMGTSLARREITSTDPYSRLGWLLFAGTIPAALLGLLFEEPLRAFFASAKTAALFLVINGVVLLLAERLRKQVASNAIQEGPDATIAQLSWGKTVFIGAVQALALIPGFSRSGVTMGSGLIAGLSNEDAARFSFLLATPIIGAAALLKIPELFKPENSSLVGPAVVGVTAYFSVKFLLRFFETNRLTPFAIYCVIGGLVYSAVLLVR
jgi:undecaprenyl-diphosphatase